MDKRTTKERERLLKELGTLGNMIRGTLVHTGRKCGRKGCHCMTGGPLHDVRYLTVSTRHARNRTVHVERSIEADVVRGIASYRRAREIVEELGRLNLESLKADARAEREAKRGRAR